MQYIYPYNSPLGPITLASDGSALTGLWFAGQKYFAATLAPTHIQQELPVFTETLRWLALYFQGSVPDFTPPLKPQGSPFRQAVWELLLQIPYGATTTYKELAARLPAGSRCAQAVGGAVGHNPISILIPCHRVLGSSGQLTGYAGGLDRKLQLLKLEGAVI